eukprot:1036141-Amphidinium_carterae.1
MRAHPSKLVTVLLPLLSLHGDLLQRMVTTMCADGLLQRVWLFLVPFQVVSSGQGGISKVVAEDSLCEMIVVALYGNQGMSRDEAPSGIFLVVPEAAAHGVDPGIVLESPTYYSHGQHVSTVRVASLLPRMLQWCRLWTMFWELSHGMPTCMFGQLESVGSSRGTQLWILVSYDDGAQYSTTLRVLGNESLNDNVSDGEFASIPDQGNLEPGQLVLPGDIPLLQWQTAKAKAPPPPNPERELLHQVLLSVQARGGRISMLETGNGVLALLGPAAVPISSSLASPSPMMSLPPPSSGMSAPLHSSGMSRPLSSMGMSAPLMSTGMPMPLASSGMSAPCASAGMSLPMLSSGMSASLQSSWMQLPCPPSSAYALSPEASTLPKGAPSLLSPPLGMTSQNSVYLDALTEARRLLGVPVNQQSVDPDLSGARGVRGKAVDADVRAAVLRGSQDAQNAINLVSLEVLDRVGRKPGAGTEHPDDNMFDFLTGEGTPNRGRRKGERGRTAYVSCTSCGTSTRSVLGPNRHGSSESMWRFLHTHALDNGALCREVHQVQPPRR